MPGIAQLAMVREIIDRGTNRTADGNRAAPAQFNRINFSRIKFKKMITPGEHLKILASPQKNHGAYTFRITVDDAVVCSGNLTLKEVL